MTATERIDATREQIEIFTLLLIGGDGAKLRAAEMIRSLDARSRRDLRAALQELDYLLDDVFLAEMREKRSASRK